MYWIHILLLALLTSASCLSAVVVWKVLDPHNVIRDHLKDGGSEKLSASLRWKSEGTTQFVVVEPSLGETSQLESNKHKTTDIQTAETSQRESNKHKTTDHQPAETQYTVNDYRASFLGTIVESSPNVAVTGTPTKPHFMGAMSQDSSYPATDYVDKEGGVWNRASSEESDQWLDTEKRASSKESDQRLDTERRASSEESEQRLDTERGASSEESDQRLDTERGASSEESDQWLDTERGASSKESDQRLDTERGASSEESDQWLDTERGASSKESDQRLDTERELKATNIRYLEIKVDITPSEDDTFPCPPCNCSYTPNRLVAADCTQLGLEEFPLSLPSKTFSIDLSFNRLRALDTSSFLSYQFLGNVTVTYNKMLNKVMQGSIGQQRSNVKILHITFCNITTIQDASFVVMPELTDLIISHNMLRNLTTSTFKGLGKLLHLDLSVNKIASLEVGTFDDLTELLSLDLSENRQLGYSEKRFPALLFKNLKKLQKLSINDNSGKDMTSYPSRTLQDLVELRELSIDGLRNPIEFGPEMKTLDKLASLEISGYCQIVNITETFFQNIPNLTSFLMDKCPNFVYVHPNAYTKLARLQSLSLHRMYNYKLETAFEDLTGLNNSPLSSITFRHLEPPISQCRYLGPELARYLQNFSLVLLDLTDNSISLMATEFLKAMPQTLETLILKRNKFTSETQSINDMSVLVGLKQLDLSMQNVNHFARSVYSLLDEVSGIGDRGGQSSNYNRDISLSPRSDQRTVVAFKDSAILKEQREVASHHRKQSKAMSQPKNQLNFPPNLRVLKASQYTDFAMQILTNVLPKNNSLSVIDFSNSFVSTWGTGQLPPGITVASLGKNYCKIINRNFFQANNSHLHLFLNNNYLGDDIASDTKGEIFSKLSITERLDISTNLIFSIPKPLFSGLSSLKYLYMSDNRLSVLNASFGHMKALEFIDCKKNSINWIDAETRNDLDTIASSPRHSLTIDLNLNPLPCTCDGLELISWMATTKVYFNNKHLLVCYTDNKVVEPMGDLEKRRQQLQRLCISKSVFIIGCSAALIVVMVIVTPGLMYRYRWKLRYLQNTAMAAMFGFRPEVSPQSGCTFDAYFVYATDTRDFVLDKCLKELEVNRGHRLCVEDRDFLAGTYIVSSIVSAVRNSTKTVVVLTPDFKEEPYCEYSFKMAVMEELYKQRTVLHLLLYQPVASDEMSHDELSLMRRNSYIEYPPDGGADEGVRRAFWDELSEVIGHSGNHTVEPVLDME